jgi:hypothetical protein
VLTDPEGRILASLDASGSEPGLESEDPLSYLLPAVDVLKLATKGSRLVFRMVSRRAAAKAEAKLAAAELGAMAGPKAAAKSAFWRAGEITPRTFTAAETKALTDKIARRMKQLGIPEKNIGIRKFPGESGRSFHGIGNVAGLRVRGRGISVHGSVVMDWAGFPEWNAATVDTRIDAIIAHEWMEFNELSHWETVELATESKLPITKEAKELLSAMQKQGEGWKHVPTSPRSRLVTRGDAVPYYWRISRALTGIWERASPRVTLVTLHRPEPNAAEDAAVFGPCPGEALGDEPVAEAVPAAWLAA